MGKKDRRHNSQQRESGSKFRGRSTHDDPTPLPQAVGEDNSEEEEEETSVLMPTAQLFMWEFGQNDPKRDSGSKMCRLGIAGTLRLGQTFPGVVLSSEATTVVSPADRQLVEQYGIAGINCSWNRLGEIPFDKMGKGRNQRSLPLLFAANSVNYGRAFKMNTAEAMAACLYIVGLKDDARLMMRPFGYGEEFFRLNSEAFEAYSCCSSGAEVQALQARYQQEDTDRRTAKEVRKTAASGGGDRSGGYVDEDDMPPRIEDEYEYEDEDEAGEASEEPTAGLAPRAAVDES